MTDQQPPSASSTPTPAPTGPEPAFTIYRPPQNSPKPAPDLPDSFFTPTSSDLKAAQATLSARTQNLVDAPLQLRTTREAAAKAKAEKWPNTTIRIRFTDRTQLEKVFPSTDKIRSVYAFVRNLLREDVKPIKFILYQSPPKRDLKVSDPKVRDLTLFDLQLSPSSVLLLRFEDDKLNGSNVPAPLVEAALSQAIDLPKPPEIPIDSPPSAPSVSKTPSSAGSSTKSSEQKVPKWLKLPGKK